MLTICLYLNILNFLVLLNNGSSLCIQMKSNISPDQYDATCSQQTTKAINEWPSDEEI